MRVLMIAPPGAGKGTQGGIIAQHFNVPHIATGDLLRDHVARETELGLEVKRHLDAGELVPDEVVLSLVQQALEEAKRADDGGYVLDGMPRNMEQARALYEIARDMDMLADAALFLQAEDEELIRRLLARAAIEHRSDDTEDVIRRRLATYYEVTHPIIDWYRSRGILVSVDAMRPSADVGREVLAALEVLNAVKGYVPDGSRRAIDLTGIGAAFGAHPQ